MAPRKQPEYWLSDKQLQLLELFITNGSIPDIAKKEGVKYMQIKRIVEESWTRLIILYPGKAITVDVINDYREKRKIFEQQFKK